MNNEQKYKLFLGLAIITGVIAIFYWIVYFLS